MNKTYTLSVFTENRIGILNRITIIFTRRHLNIESITASETEVQNIYRYTIVVITNQDQVNKVAAQIDKLVEVIKTFVHEEEEVVHQEIALYKVKTDSFTNSSIEKIIRENHGRVLTVDKEFFVIEKTGHKAETQKLFNDLVPFGVLEFARSGRVAVTKPMKELSTYLKELEMQSE